MQFAPINTSGGSVKMLDLEGHLLIVEPIEFRPKVPTSLGETDAIAVTVHDIDEKTTHTDLLWFSRALVASLRVNVGKKVLGVLGKGPAKPGQNAPWVLTDASMDPEAVREATAYLEPIVR